MNDKTIQAERWLKEVKSSEIACDPLVIYYFINKKLNMSPGKVAVQCARAAMIMHAAEIQLNDSLLPESLDELFRDDFMHGNKSITLKANGSQMERLLTGDYKELISDFSEATSAPLRLYPTYDIGATEVPTNSLTVIAMTPFRESVIRPLTKKFQLY